MKNKKRLILIITLSVLGALLLAAGIYAIVCVSSFRALEETGLPRVDIVTEGGASIVSKETYVRCTVGISGTDEEYCIEGAPAGIRGRGNDTWTAYPKKPYRIKFDEKVSVFGETKNKSWVLLAMYNDFSLVRDRLAFGMADALDADFSPAYHYVDLYLNGKYMGVYLLTDQVDENKGRTNVKADFTAEDTEVPFLVELDSRAPEEGVEGLDWFIADNGSTYAVKYPDASERYTQVQFDYIENYIETVDDLCRKQGVTLAELSEYIDVQSLIDFYIVLEVMGQSEINWKSVYMSKSTDGKLVMGPVWDFDWAATGPSIGKYADQYKDDYTGLRSNGNWFGMLYNGSPEFRAALAARWQEVRPKLMATIDAVEAEKPMLERAARRNELRWYWYRFDTNYVKNCDEVLHWCRNRILWLDGAFGV